jgi:hypothetical protein
MQNLLVCGNDDYHFRTPRRERIYGELQEGSSVELLPSLIATKASA